MERSSWSRLVLVGVISALAFLATGCPGEGSYVETAMEAVSGTIQPSEQMRVGITIEIDAADVSPWDTLQAVLSLPPTPRTAVLGEIVEHGADSSGLQMAQFQHPDGPEFQYPVDELDLDLTRCVDAGRCTYEMDVTIGNLGGAIAEWTVTAILTRGASKDTEIEIPSLQIRIEDQRHDSGLWETTGPVSLNGELGVPVAFAVTVSTSIQDPERFDVLITEPRHHLITRTVQAVTGRTDLQWALTHYEPSAAPLSTQASCDAAGCRIDAVAIFRPGHEDDWWIPVVVPKPDAMGTVVSDNAVTIDVRPLSIAMFEGRIGSVESGSFTLELDAPATTTQAMIWWQVKPENVVLTLPVGDISTADGVALGHYRWFDLDCDQWCHSDLSLSWQKPPDRWNQPVEGELAYSGFVIAGEGNGIAAEEPLRVEVKENR